MRITPFILLAIGVFGLLYPEKLIETNSGGGRFVFLIIIALGLINFWFLIKRRK